MVSRMHFFVLQDEPISDGQCATVDVVDADGSSHGDAPRCETCGDYVGLREWLPPLRIELETWGTQYGDVATTGTDLVVSLKFKEAWQESGLTGLSGFESVEIVKLKRRRKKAIGDPPQYFRAIVQRSQTAVDLAASEFVWDAPPTCPTCLLGDNVRRWSRVVIDENTWTGEDVFIPRGLAGVVIVSARFKQFCDRTKMKNVVLVPAETYEYDSDSPPEII